MTIEILVPDLPNPLRMQLLQHGIKKLVKQ